MPLDEVIAGMTERTRIALQKMWNPSDVSPTMVREEVLDLRMKGFMRKQQSGLLEFTPLGLEVCRTLFGPASSDPVNAAQPLGE